MHARYRAMFGTSALLYAGPLYAGLAGYGFETLPVFAAFFMVWLAVVRPGDWPETLDEWKSPRAIAWPMLIFIGQLGVVAFSLFMGNAIRAFAAIEVPLPLPVTLAMSFGAVVLARALRGREPKAFVRVPGESLGLGSGILDIAAPIMPGRRQDQLFVDEVSTYLAAFGQDAAPRSGIEPLMDMIQRENMAKPLLAAFRHSKVKRLPFIQAEAMLVMRPGVAGMLIGKGQIGSAVAAALATREPVVVADVADLARALIARLPDAALELPSPDQLDAMASEIAAVSAPAANALRALSHTLSGERKAA